ncbi:WD40 repeat domain-containing protein [Micromonospora chersina]|uniref:WD40 repeat domain-containing protein n=1 Tax=Micromonospora chersina TaxID=47854 RepID=UPI0033EE464F
MSVRLREALREAAAEVPAYPVHERAVRTARRTRRRMAAAVAAVLVLVALVPVAVRGGGRPSIAPAGVDGPALPDRIGLPAFGSLRATDRPRLGPAALIFSGQARGLTGLLDEDGTIGIVGADADRYRTWTVGFEAPAGERVLLSPDGRRIAVPAGSSEHPRVDLVDLVDGTVWRLPSPRQGSTLTEPAGWAPDGTALVVRDTTPTNPEGSAYANTLSLVRLDTGRAVRLLETEQLPIFGTPVAFTADGSRLAFQVGDKVLVTGEDGRQVTSFPLPPESGLAGKGAWLPDGTLALVSRDPDTTRWRLRRVDPATGRDLGVLALPAVDGVTTIRLLGWWPDGSALVVGYRPDPDSPARFDGPLDMDQRTVYPNVQTVRVLELTPGAAAPNTLLTAPDQVLAIDVADAVVRAGRIRAADPPAGPGGRFWWAAGAAALVVGGLLARRLLRRGRAPRLTRGRAPRG